MLGYRTSTQNLTKKPRRSLRKVYPVSMCLLLPSILNTPHGFTMIVFDPKTLLTDLSRIYRESQVALLRRACVVGTYPTLTVPSSPLNEPPMYQYTAPYRAAQLWFKLYRLIGVCFIISLLC